MVDSADEPSTRPARWGPVRSGGTTVKEQPGVQSDSTEDVLEVAMVLHGLLSL